MRHFLITIYLFCSVSVFSQELPFHNYTTANGLSQSQVLSILQDRFGYMWFGSFNGVDRYDGVNFVHYDFYEHSIRAIYEDSRGLIWFATRKNGVYYMPVAAPDMQNVRNLDWRTGLQSNDITAIQEDQQHNLWLASADQGIYRLCFEDDSLSQIKQFTTRDGLINNGVISFMLDYQGRLWCGTVNGVSVLKNINSQNVEFKNYTKNDGLPDSIVYKIYQTPDSSVLCGTLHGVYRLSPQSNKFSQLRDIKNQPICVDTRAIQVDSRGKLWLGTNGHGVCQGTYHPEKDTWEFQSYSTRNGLASNRIFVIIEDRQKNLWFGTWGNGVSKLRKNDFINYTMANGQLISNVYGIYRDNSKQLWLGTDGLGVLIFKDGKFTNFDQQSGLKSNSVWHISSDSRQNIWLGTLDGLKCYLPTTQQFIHFDSSAGIAGKNILCVHDDHAERFWVGSQDGGVSLFSKNPILNNQKRKVTAKCILPFIPTYTLYETMDQSIWAGTSFGAYQFITHQREFEEINNYHRRVLATSLIWCIYEDSLQRMWFGTQGNGLVCLSDDTLKYYSKKHGLCDNTIYFMQPVGNQRIWLGTNRGIDLVQLKSDSLTVLKHFDSRDGLPANEMNANCSFFDDERHFWFGSVGGASQCMLEREFSESVAPLIYIQDLKNIDEPIPLSTSPIKLNYQQNYLTFTYLGLNFKNEFGIKYQYMLEGFDKTWSKLTSQREVQYTELGAGKYTFKVKALNSDGVWSLEPATFAFEITPPWWLAWWMHPIGFFIIIGLAFMIYEFRVRQIKKSNRLLEMKVLQRTKELAESEQKYRTLIESSNDVIFTLNSAGQYTTINETLKRRYSIESTNYLGKTQLDFIPREVDETMRRKIKQALRGKVETFQWSFTLPKYDLIEMETTLSPLKERNGHILGVVGISRDITERIQMAKALKTERDKLKTILEAMEDMVVITSEDSKILYLNRAFKEVYSYIHVGSLSADFFDPEAIASQEEFAKPGSESDSLRPWEFEDKHHKQILSGISCPIELPEGLCKLIILRDITERRKLERERLNAERLAAVTQTAIAYNHEINNPLFGIMGYLEIMMQEEADQKRYEELNLIYDAAKRIAEVTKRLRRLTRPAIRDYVGAVKMLDVAASIPGEF